MSCAASFDTARGIGIFKAKKRSQVVSKSPVIFARPKTHSRKRKFSDEVVLQEDGAEASVTSRDEVGPTSVHEETGARVETEYTADDYELPAGESHSIYYDCDWDHNFSADPSAANTVDESVVSSSLSGRVLQFPIWSKLNLAATELALYGRVPALDLVASGHLTA